MVSYTNSLSPDATPNIEHHEDPQPQQLGLGWGPKEVYRGDKSRKPRADRQLTEEDRDFLASSKATQCQGPRTLVLNSVYWRHGYMAHMNEERLSWESIASMAAFLGLHYKTVQRANKELVRRGLLGPVAEYDWGAFTPLGRRHPQSAIVYEVRTIHHEFSAFPQSATKEKVAPRTQSPTPPDSESYPPGLKVLPPRTQSPTPPDSESDNIELDRINIGVGRNIDNVFPESEKRVVHNQSDKSKTKKKKQERIRFSEYKARMTP